MKRFLAGIAAVAALALAGSAYATVYDLDIDGCSSGCGLSSYGTVTVTGEGTTSLHFVVSLDPTVYFNQAGGGHDAFAWSLVGDPTITVSNLPATFGTNGSQAAGSNHENGFGNFDYIVSWLGPPNSNSPLTTQTLTFDVTGLVALTLDPNDDVFMAVDVARVGTGGVSTGMIGGSLCVGDECGGPGPGGGPVPEPATWAMMLLGFGGLGAMLRRNRRQAALA